MTLENILIGEKKVGSLRAETVFALELCEQVEKVAMHHFLKGVNAVAKDDGSPVTIADTECERLIRAAIEKRYPHDAILGEEEGATGGAASDQSGAHPRRRWLVDPIDGTYGFARGSSVWSTLLALEENGQIIMGVVHAPALKETYWAEKNQGAYRNGLRLNVSKINAIGESQFDFGGLNRIIIKGYGAGFERIVRLTARQRSPGDLVGFTHVLEGLAEAQLEVGVKPWDLAPFRILIEEAGGKYSDLNGGDSIYTGNCLISNGLLHGQFLQALLGDSPNSSYA